MKKIFILILLFTCKAFCEWKDYEVVFEDKQGYFELFVTTIDERPSMAPLIIHDMHITLSEGCFPGLLSINLQMDPKKASLPALGVRTGHFQFQKGEDLPNISDGLYELMIDGTSYGQINIDSKKGTFYPLEEKVKDE